MRVAIIAAALFLTTASAYAHHSLALFDSKAPVTIQGTVTKVEWRSPHTVIFVNAKESNGQVTEWRVETTPNSWLINRAGWTIDSVKPGDEVKVELYAYADKTLKYGFLLRVIKADGTVWKTALDIGARRGLPPEPGQ